MCVRWRQVQHALAPRDPHPANPNAFCEAWGATPPGALILDMVQLKPFAFF
jgi:hypothetical protein